MTSALVVFALSGWLLFGLAVDAIARWILGEHDDPNWKEWRNK